jgi:hypothetical protein
MQHCQEGTREKGFFGHDGMMLHPIKFPTRNSDALTAKSRHGKLIRQRCDEGIKRAKAKGTVFGRKSVLDAGQRRKIAERYAAGETMRELAIDYEVGEATIWRALRGQSAQNGAV